jgi:hypothetical protein
VAVCQVCNAPLPKKEGNRGRVQKFCSAACKSNNYHYKRTGTTRADTRECRGCGAEFSIAGQRNPDGKLKRSDTRWCSRCRPELSQGAQAKRLHYRYGIALDQYEAASQRGCEICGTTDAKLHVDHDHSCCPGGYTCGGCVRGFLCGQCNQALGLLKDDPDRMVAAAAYVLKSQNVLGGAPSRN